MALKSLFPLLKKHHCNGRRRHYMQCDERRYNFEKEEDDDEEGAFSISVKLQLSTDNRSQHINHHLLRLLLRQQ